MKDKQNEQIQKATIYDIAKITGTTISAVSRAFSPTGKIAPEKRKLILDAAAKYGYKPNRSASALSRKPIKIGFAALANIPEYYRELVEGVNSAYRRLADYRVECEIRLLSNSECCDERCAALLGELRDAGCDGVLLSFPVYGPRLQAKIAELADEGVPVGTITSDAPESRRLFSTQNSLDVAGRLAAQLAALFSGRKKNEGEIRTVIFSGSAESLIHASLIAGFDAEAKSHGVKIIEVFDTRDVPEIAAECVDEFLARYFAKGEHGIDGIYISSANSIPIIKRIKEAGVAGDLGIVASDVFPELADFIREGTVGATIYQNPFEQARLAFETMYIYLTEHRLRQELFFVTPQPVMKSNLSLYTGESKI